MSDCFIPWSYSEKIIVFPPFGLRLIHQSPEKETLKEISPSTTYDPGWGWRSSQMGYHENPCFPWFYCVKCDFLHFKFYQFDLCSQNSYIAINLDLFKSSYILKLLKWFYLIMYGLILRTLNFIDVPQIICKISFSQILCWCMSKYMYIDGQIHL